MEAIEIPDKNRSRVINIIVQQITFNKTIFQEVNKDILKKIFNLLFLKMCLFTSWMMG